MRATYRLIWPPVSTVVLGLLCWEVLVLALGVQPYLLPAPSAIGSSLIEHFPTLMAATGQTALATLAGFCLAVVGGVFAGAILATFGFLRRGVYPLANLLQMVPLVAVAPLLTIWVGYGARAVIASACVVAIFPVIANTVDGLRAVDPSLKELFALYGAKPLQTWIKLELPAALPQIFTGLRIAAGLAVIGAIVGEFCSAYMGDQAPIGIVILTAIREANTDLVFAAIFLSACIVFILFGLVSGGAYFMLRRWHPSAQDK